jgi:hypothetical protein
MARLGELLVAAGLLAAEQVDQALRAQVLWGGRLGTNLVELHYLELDPLSKALGRQHRLPAALARHFDKADPELQRMLSPELAERFSCVPLLRMGPDGHVVVASLTPLQPRQIAVLAEELGVDVPRLVPAIAAELRIRYQLERVYRIRRAARFLRARGKSIPPFPAFQVLPVAPEAELDVAPSLPTSTHEIAMYQPEAEPGAAPGAERRTTEPGTPPRLATEPGAPAALRLDRARTEPDLPPELPPAADATEDDLLPVEVEPPPAPRESSDDLRELGDEINAAFGAAFHDDLDEAGAHTLDDDLASASGASDAATDGAAVDEASARERRTYVRTIADAPSSDSERQALVGRIAIRKVAIGSAPRVMAGVTLGEATRAIRRSTGRDRVAELVIDTLDRFAPACEAAILLVIRGATAIGWKGFQRAGGGLAEIAVPMDDAGLVPQAVELNVTLRRASGELAEIDRLLLASLGGVDGDLVVVPISIAEQVMCVIAIATAENAPIACAEPIAAAAGAAFARLMRDASR